MNYELLPCGKCSAFAHPIDDDKNGECHRLPPTLHHVSTDQFLTDYPKVSYDDLGCMEGIFPKDDKILNGSLGED